ncbi:MAG: hypothetical protein ACU0DT_07555 [Albimonas sp.]|uniref:hypothetical protein n=1 Tax=Albimonas sp. TaxID=1872425 RepID=UPI004057B957
MVRRPGSAAPPPFMMPSERELRRALAPAAKAGPEAAPAGIAGDAPPRRKRPKDAPAEASAAAVAPKRKDEPPRI